MVCLPFLTRSRWNLKLVCKWLKSLARRIQFVRQIFYKLAKYAKYPPDLRDLRLFCLGGLGNIICPTCVSLMISTQYLRGGGY